MWTPELHTRFLNAVNHLASTIPSRTLTCSKYTAAAFGSDGCSHLTGQSAA